jgi:hypothetical protein
MPARAVATQHIVQRDDVVGKLVAIFANFLANGDFLKGINHY